MSITYYRSHFTNEPRAKCDTCNKVWAYWEDEEELDHDCNDMTTTDYNYTNTTNEELSLFLMLLARPFTGVGLPDSDRELLIEAARRLKNLTNA